MSKLPSIMIGIDFYRKARNRKWIQDNGAEAVIVLQEVWIASSQEKDCKIQKDECPYLPFPVQVTPEKVISILESAVAVGLLDSEGDFFFNSQIVKDHQNFEKKQLNYKEGRKKRESTEDSPTILTRSCVNHSEERILNSEKRVLNLEKEGVQGERKPFVAPPPIKNPQFPDVLPPAKDADEFEIAAEDSLEKPENQPWVNENTYMLTGRRPLKKFPLVRLTRRGLAEILRIHSKNGLDLDDSREVLRRIEIKLKGKQDRGEKLDFTNAETWATGWAMSEQLQIKTNVNRLERSVEVKQGRATYARTGA